MKHFDPCSLDKNVSHWVKHYNYVMNYDSCIICLLFLFVQFDLGHEGACEEGDVINDVTLPPWGSTAHDFIRIHREVSL